MSSDVNRQQRAYRSDRRAEQARATRNAIVEAARRLFLEDGFSATTVPTIAEAAGVSVQTVYKVFGGKAALAKAVFDIAIAGDDEPLPVHERPSLMAVREATDGRTKLELYGRFLGSTAPRHAPVQLMIREAAAVDADAAGVWQQLNDERLRGMGMFAADLHDNALLRPDVSEREARDVLWVHNAPEVYQLLVVSRGWSAERYGEWIAGQLIAALL